jgi:hypothetical protein
MEDEELPPWMDEAYYKMSKKIAQLTRVIGMLVNKNEEQVPPTPPRISSRRQHMPSAWRSPARRRNRGAERIPDRDALRPGV